MLKVLSALSQRRTQRLAEKPNFTCQTTTITKFLSSIMNNKKRIIHSSSGKDLKFKRTEVTADGGDRKPATWEVHRIQTPTCQGKWCVFEVSKHGNHSCLESVASRENGVGFHDNEKLNLLSLFGEGETKFISREIKNPIKRESKFFFRKFFLPSEDHFRRSLSFNGVTKTFQFTFTRILAFHSSSSLIPQKTKKPKNKF